MSLLNTLKAKAVTTLANVLDKKRAPEVTKDQRFCSQHHLPDTETIVGECTVELSVKSDHSLNEYPHSPQGRLYLTQHFLVFQDAFDSTTCSFVVHLSSVKKVERLPSASFGFALKVSTHSKLHVFVYLVGMKSECERFGHRLRTCLEDNLKNITKLQPFLQTCYSEYLLARNNVSQENVASIPPGGLGLVFKFPGNPVELRDRSKMKLWFDLFKADGRNLSLVCTPTFHKLIRVGLPNRLRGEIWELCCGSMYLRFDNPHEYQAILADNKNSNSVAIDEIEKDLNRSLPEYVAYQNPAGISRLRNVLTAYSWKNPGVGYCQAMNIVVAALLIFMSEEQAFWCLNVICDHIVPGYYSKTMYGTLLDQKVFESLVQETMPLLWDHITKYDIQLSVVSLPWFLSLYLNSLPLVYAFRILDIFFQHGPKTLFQVALAILKLNGDAILNLDDDGSFIQIIKEYFSTLDHSAHPDSSNIKYKSITKFQELLVTAFKEFLVVEDATIEKYRAKHRDSIYSYISTFVKRTELRNLPKTHNLSATDLGSIYDRFYSIVETYNVTMASGKNSMDFEAFYRFMSEICGFISPEIPEDHRGIVRDFVHRLFQHWAASHESITFSELVVGLNQVMEPDLMTAIANFYDLYADNGKIDREGILKISEDLLAITVPWKDGLLLDDITNRNVENAVADQVYNQQETENRDIVLPAQVHIDKAALEAQQTERYLSAASAFIQRAFEYAQPQEDDVLVAELAMDHKITHNAALNPNTPVYLSLATFRMVILADETYELLFSKTLRDSVDLNKPLDSQFDTMRNLRDMFDGLLADGRAVATKVRRRMDSASSAFDHDTGSVKSGKSHGEDDDEDDFDADINDKDKAVLLGAETVDLKAELKPEKPRDESQKTARAGIEPATPNLIEFET